MKLLKFILIVYLFMGCSANTRKSTEEKTIINEKAKNMNDLRITLAQVNHAGWDFKKQTTYILEAFDSICPNSTDLIVLPEMCVSRMDEIQKEAIRLNTHIVIGVSQRAGENSFHNKAVVISPDGKIVTEYIKMFLHQEESSYGYQGGDSTVVFKIGNAKIGLLICGDLGLGVEASLDLFHKDVDLIVIPASAFSNSLEYWRWHMVVKSLDTGIPMCMVNYADFSEDGAYTTGGGHSMIVTPLPKGHENKHIDSLLLDKNISPMSHIYCELDSKQEIRTIDIDINAYKNYRKNMIKHRTKGLNLLNNTSNER